MGISLWIVPSPEDAQRLKTVMAAKQDGQQNLSLSSYPSFHPHITLASFSCAESAAPLSDIRAAMPKLQHGLPIEFKSIDIGTSFFRSVYIAISLTSALSAMHEEVHTKLGIDPRTPAFPHASLCYIDDGDALLGERVKFFRELENDGRLRKIEGESGISLNCGDFLVEDWMSGFLATEVWVASCDGPVEGWKILDTILLT
ncbi:RNA ligase/cyclic nucleotide phosphodiesterase [Lyophyllum atratum]|nr:RNA ligase/cyclic nucleotide phosphodiesterase [Lyophyllum atratum]